MALDSKLRAILDAQPAAPPLDQVRPEFLRARTAELVAGLHLADLPQVPVTEALIAGPGGPIPIRIYRPQGSGLFPCVVHFHGGGWVAGNLETHDPFCRYLCHAAHVVIVSVDYRLAPEHRFPAAVEDAEAAVRWVFEHTVQLSARPNCIIVSGDSAGGNLAAVVARRLRGKVNLCGQMLLFPVTDHPSAHYPSYEENATGFGLQGAQMEWYWRQYVADEDQNLHPDASPLRAQDLSGLPAAMVMTGQYDVLRDEGIRYADRLRDAGTQVTHVHYGTLHHNFPVWPLTVGALPQSRDAREEMSNWIHNITK